MRRADRLFEIIQQLRGDRLVTAQALAVKLEVSVRTVYRDIRDLQASGVPIDGAAGVGYLLRPGYQLPPLMFLPEEIEALIVGARMVKAWAGRRISDAAAEALVKIAAVVPDERMRAAQRVPIFATGTRLQDERARQSRHLRQGNRRAASRCASPITMRRAAAAGARSGRWHCISGDRCGRSPHGASCAMISGLSASTVPSGWR